MTVYHTDPSVTIHAGDSLAGRASGCLASCKTPCYYQDMNTKTRRAAIRGAGRSVLIDALQNHEDFKTSGSLRGQHVNGAWEPGWLSGEDRVRFAQDAQSIIYVVTSYATPIAWVTLDGYSDTHKETVYIVKQSFSVTTGRQQSIVRAHLGGVDA